MTSATTTTNDLASISLSDAERQETAKIAAELAGSAPQLVDAAEWMAAARDASCRLPVRLVEAIRKFRHDAGDDAAILIRNLPIDEASLPLTPSVPQSVERHATVPASVIVSVMLQIGEIISFQKEKLGALVQNVVPVPGQEALQSNAGSTALEMHTENAFHPFRPDFLGLLCVRSDHDDSGRLCVSSIRQACRRLPDSVLKVLWQPRFLTNPPPSFGDVLFPTQPQGVLQGHVDDPDVCVDFYSTHPLDDEAANAMAALRTAVEEVVKPLLLRAGDLAILDNRLALHGRTAFQPRYDGRDRWLHRTFVHLNHRRSRAARPDGGFVLS